jgi:hypothetical protein
MNKNIVPKEEYNIKIYNKTEIKDSKIIKNVYWYTNPIILNKVISECKNNKFNNIIEIGPGSDPFPLANIFIGYDEKIDNFINVDIDKNKIPFEDNIVDFIYCRHVLEDIQNPDFALEEIMRVSKSFYIETPSPLVEITKNIDAFDFSDQYCGYIHHRYIIWYDEEENSVHILPKYGVIENILKVSDELKEKILYLLNNYPVYWNTYIFKINDKVNIKIYNHFDLETYPKILLKAIETSIKSTNNFISKFFEK